MKPSSESAPNAPDDLASQPDLNSRSQPPTDHQPDSGPAAVNEAKAEPLAPTASVENQTVFSPDNSSFPPEDHPTFWPGGPPFVFYNPDDLNPPPAQGSRQARPAAPRRKPGPPRPTRAEMKARFGPPPVLSSEDLERYYGTLAGFLVTLGPNDFIVETLIKDLVDATWDIARHRRLITLQIESTGRENEKSRAARDAARQQAAKDAGHEHPPETDRATRLADTIDATVPNVDRILDENPKEFLHAKAFRQEMDHLQNLERGLDRAIHRRNDALQALEHYRDNMGLQARRLSEHLLRDQLDRDFADQREDYDLALIERRAARGWQ